VKSASHRAVTTPRSDPIQFAEVEVDLDICFNDANGIYTITLPVGVYLHYRQMAILPNRGRRGDHHRYLHGCLISL
jgi:hypothetical protein